MPDYTLETLTEWMEEVYIPWFEALEPDANRSPGDGGDSGNNSPNPPPPPPRP